MYLPGHFEVTDRATLEAFIERHSFATLVNVVDGAPFATHLPLVLDRGGSERGSLQGHVARANPQWKSFDGTNQALAIFHGPHAYVSPSSYAASPAVPTWNYAVVHAYGAPRPIDDEVWLGRLVDRLVGIYESGRTSPWPGTLPADYKAKQLRAIVGFEMAITRIEGKFKLNQNRSLDDQRGAIRDLETRDDPQARAVAAMMKQRLKETP